jgi:hypothetical protein
MSQQWEVCQLIHADDKDGSSLSLVYSEPDTVIREYEAEQQHRVIRVLGLGGWELVTVNSWYLGGSTVMYYFKRPVEAGRRIDEPEIDLPEVDEPDE